MHRETDHVEVVSAPEGTPSGDEAQQKRDATSMVFAGAAIGLLGAMTAAIGGAVCPVCVLAAPALMGVGAFRRWRSGRARRR